MNIFKKLYSKFVGLVVILLILMAANSFVSLFNEPENVQTQELEKTVEIKNIENAKDREVIQEKDAIDEVTSTDPISYISELDDKNAFELLKSVAEVEYKEYDFGVFIESINGIKGDDKNFWAFYVNDEKAQAGADKTILQKGDRVEWRYEEIE